MFIKGKMVNKQCTTKVKRKGDYCSRHRPSEDKEPEAKPHLVDEAPVQRRG
jgi:hypothetical protein